MTDSTEDFAALFNASQKAKRIEKGQTVEGTIVAIGRDVAFVDVGGKGEATVDLAELKDEDGNVEVTVGERIHAVVVSTTGGLTLSRRLARGAATDAQLEEAYRSGLAVEGKVEREVKGGYELKIGRSRAFCPYSQMDLTRTEPASHIGHVYPFRVIEYKDGGRNLVVSRRAILEEEQRAKADEIRRSIVPGAIITGRVASVRDFGAFVDLGGGVQGLLHVSEIGWSRVSDPSQVLKAGEDITVKVLRVDEATDRIALGLKQLSEDPWSKVSESYEVGQVRAGRVTRLTDFGAFVELEPGVEALAHVSTFTPASRTERWTAALKPGTIAAFEIVNIDLEKRRIGVALVPEGSTRGDAALGGSDLAGRDPVEPAAPTSGFGSFADKLRGAIKSRQN